VKTAARLGLRGKRRRLWSMRCVGPWGSRRAGPGSARAASVPWHGRTRARARVSLEVGDDPDMWVPAVTERTGEEGAGLLGSAGRKGAAAGWAVREEGRGGKGQVGLGRVGVKRRKKMGRARKEERESEKKKFIQMHLNFNLKFKFIWKTSNKIIAMRHEMHKTYIFLYFFLGSSKLLLIHGKCSKIKKIEQKPYGPCKESSKIYLGS
jgi:hypothetical protein